MATDFWKLLSPLTRRENCFFCCLCCRSIFHLMSDKEQTIFMLIEEHLLGTVSLRRIQAARKRLEAMKKGGKPNLALYYTADYVIESAKSVQDIYTQYIVGNLVVTITKITKNDQHAHFINEVHNPGKSFSHPEATLMAAQIKDEMAWNQIPVLGDRLQDLGCTDSVILDHCYQDHEHGLGCWVIEMLLN